jgi:hypothetical protein
MKALGIMGIIAGAPMVLIGALTLFDGVIEWPLLINGLIAILCGAICIALDGVHAGLQALDNRLSKTEELIRSQQPSAADQIVDQLRQEGLLRPGTTGTDEDIGAQ